VLLWGKLAFAPFIYIYILSIYILCAFYFWALCFFREADFCRCFGSRNFWALCLLGSSHLQKFGFWDPQAPRDSLRYVDVEVTEESWDLNGFISTQIRKLSLTKPGICVSISKYSIIPACYISCDWFSTRYQGNKCPEVTDGSVLPCYIDRSRFQTHTVILGPTYSKKVRQSLKLNQNQRLALEIQGFL